jgi:hypothetical protein
MADSIHEAIYIRFLKGVHPDGKGELLRVVEVAALPQPHTDVIALLFNDKEEDLVAL